jgi:hypothetical protein
MGTFVYRGVGSAWLRLVTWRGTNVAPANRSDKQTQPGGFTARLNIKMAQADKPPDAAYPESSGDFAATPNQRSSITRCDTAAAVKSETALYNAQGQIHVCMSGK